MTSDSGEPAHQIAVDINPAVTDCPDEGWFEQVAQATLAVTDFAGPAEVSMLITTDEEVRALNARYRGLDEPTDVLSFALLDDVPEGESFFPEDRQKGTLPPGFVSPPADVPHLGDVVISYQRAVAQAREAGYDTRRELAHLTAHGILHLLGYDHQRADEEAVMRAKENAVLGLFQ